MPVDYSKLTDAELDALLEKQSKDYSSMTDAELDAELAKSSQAPANVPSEKINQLESGARGLAQGASFGFADELSGRAGQLAGALGLAPDMGYEYYRDYARGQDKLASEQNPYTYGGGQLAGGVATAAVPGLGAANSFKGAAMTGAAMGGINSVGSSESDLLSQQMLKDAAVGTVLGGAAGGAGQKLGGYLTGSKAVTSGLDESANSMAAKGLGLERKTLAKLGEKKTNAAGEYALDKGIFKFPSSTKSMTEANNIAKEAAGRAQRGVYETLDAYGASSFNPLEVAVKLEEKIGPRWNTPLNRGATNQYENTIETIFAFGDKPIPLTKAQELKELLNGAADWNQKQNVTEKMQIARDAYGVVAKAIDDAAADGASIIGEPSIAKALTDANAQYSAASTAGKLLRERANKAGNKSIGLTDWLTGIAGLSGAALTGGIGALPAIAGTAALVGTKKLGEAYGPQAGATAARTISNILKKTNAGLGKAAAPIAAGTELTTRNLPSAWMGMSKKENKK